jgi:hypothetical protein
VWRSLVVSPSALLSAREMRLEQATPSELRLGSGQLSQTARALPLEQAKWKRSVLLWGSA